VPRIQYEDWNPKPETLQLVLWADAVARDYKRRGYSLSVRQLYYQGVSQNKFANSERSYKNLIAAVSRARLAGLMDWRLLEDRTRETHATGWFGREMPNPWDLARGTKWSMSHDLWEGQENRVEIWVEKQALEEVASKAAGQFRVPYIACRGYMSQSEMWVAGHDRLKEYGEAGQHPIILHIGDHDPSGIDMTRDVEERLTMFAETDVEVRRLALNWDQIEQYNPPPNPAKITDSRAKGYIREYGVSSWELDALRPELLVELLTDEIGRIVDKDLFNERLAEEERERDGVEERYNRLEENWDAVEAFLDEMEDEE
jgi:hypothetical protein